MKGILQYAKTQLVETKHAKTANEKLEGELQQLKNQIKIVKQTMMKLDKAIKEQRESLKFVIKEKEMMPRENLHLKEREEQMSNCSDESKRGS
eukprot:11346520-Ditylum_brightwellii.AAC.1